MTTALYDPRLERRLVAAVSLAPEMAWPEAGRLAPSDFGDSEARGAWMRLSETMAAGQVVDPSEYRAFHDAGDPPLLLPAWVRETVADISQATVLRRAVGLAIDIAGAAYDHEVDRVRSLLSQAPAIGLEHAAGTLVPSRSVSAEVWDTYADAEKTAGYAMPTGLGALDHALGGGLEAGTLTIFMARPGIGKTAALAQIADYVSSLGRTVAVFSKEMTAHQWIARMASRRARVPLLALKQGTASADARERFLAECLELAERKTLHLDDSTMQTTDDVAAECERLKRSAGRLDFILADHLRLFADKADNETHRLGRVSWGLKQLAKRLGARVVAAAQLSRAVENKDDKKPDLRDLRDSGEIEENADTVIAIYREKYYKPTANNVAEFWLRKDRNGERNAQARMVYLDSYMSFEPLARGN